MKTIPAVVLVLIAAASGCSKSDLEWSISSGVATPIVSDTNTGTGPLVIEEEKAAPQQKPARHLGSQTFCSRGNDHRTLEMINHRMGCRLSYHNQSQVETVAEATWGKKVCQQVRSHIVQKLKSAGYSCS